jgi:undecaprenyl-diphosphatase
MNVADLQQWLGLGAMAVWLVVAVVVVLVRLRGDGRPPLRVLIATGAGAMLFAAYGGVVDAVADPGPLAAADVPVLRWMIEHRSGPQNSVMITISNLGGTLGMTILTALAVVVLLWRRQVRTAIVVLLAGTGSGPLVSGFKNLNARQRPPAETQLVAEPTYALPSGHALGSMVVIGILAVVVARMLRSTALRVLVVVVAAVVIASIGVSRLYLGVHWLTDVLAGWLLGGAWLVLWVGALAAPAGRWTVPAAHGPAAADGLAASPGAQPRAVR